MKQLSCLNGCGHYVPFHCQHFYSIRWRFSMNELLKSTSGKDSRPYVHDAILAYGYGADHVKIQTNIVQCETRAKCDVNKSSTPILCGAVVVQHTHMQRVRAIWHLRHRWRHLYRQPWFLQRAMTTMKMRWALLFAKETLCCESILHNVPFSIVRHHSIWVTDFPRYVVVLSAKHLLCFQCEIIRELNLNSASWSIGHP